MRLIALTIVLLSAATPAQAWNALGHKVIADIAWEELDEPTRKQIVETLRRHPRFDEDFAKQMPADANEDRWIFQQAAVWPDLARGFKGEDRSTYDHPTWHYVNFPLFVRGDRPLLGVNLSMDYPPAIDKSKWNVGQAAKHCQAALESDASPSDKALAYCWLFHLVGDLHQPMHSTALFSERFPTGDRGGNSIPTIQGENLHSLWDNLIGRQHKPNDVNRAVAKLREVRTPWNVKTTSGVEAWIQESHDLARSFAYSPEIIEATQAAGQMQKINLPREYLEEAGGRARAQVVAAGLRLAAVIKSSPRPKVGRSVPLTRTIAKPEASPPPVQSLSPTTAKGSASTSLTHWLNLNGEVRHNSSCRHFNKTKRGRPCSADEGRPCGICGG